MLQTSPAVFIDILIWVLQTVSVKQDLRIAEPLQGILEELSHLVPFLGIL